MSNQNKNSLNHNYNHFNSNITNSQMTFLESINLIEEVDTCTTTQELLELLALAKKKLQDQIYQNIHQKEILNPYKMTMVDPISLQKSLDTMVKNNCEVAVIEVSSQGLEQNRHWGLGKFAMAIFLNLYPEHIESHGNFENYKHAKMKLFKNLQKTGIAIGNGDDKYCDEILTASPKTTSKYKIKTNTDYQISPYSNTMFKTFAVNTEELENNSHFVADFEVENAVLAGTTADKYLQKYHSRHFNYKILYYDYYPIPGRMEWVVQNNKIVFK